MTQLQISRRTLYREIASIGKLYALIFKSSSLVGGHRSAESTSLVKLKQQFNEVQEDIFTNNVKRQVQPLFVLCYFKRKK